MVDLAASRRPMIHSGGSGTSLPWLSRQRPTPIPPQNRPRPCCLQPSIQAELIELRNGMTAEDLVCRLLVRRGVYTRTCDDKKGLEPGKFIRVASRCRSENRFVLRAFRDILR